MRATLSLLVFLGVSGLFGGIGLIFGIWGLQNIPREPLDRIPVIDTWLVPGLVLAIGFGLGSLVAAYGVLRRQHWSWWATQLLGLGQLAWLLVEAIYVGFSVLLVIYAAVGVALVVLPQLTPVRTHLAALPDRRPVGPAGAQY